MQPDFGRVIAHPVRARYFAPRLFFGGDPDMQRLRQLTFASLQCDRKKRKTRREIFLERMDSLIPPETLVPPATEPAMGVFPVSTVWRQITPGSAGAKNPEDRIDEPTIVLRPPNFPLGQADEAPATARPGPKCHDADEPFP